MSGTKAHLIQSKDTLNFLSHYIGVFFPNLIERIVVVDDSNIISIFVKPEKIYTFVELIKLDELIDSSLTDMWAEVSPEKHEPFCLVHYYFLSYHNNVRILVTTETKTGAESDLPSISSVWPSAAWLEREVKDMFGIIFSGSLDPRRLLVDYGFQGYPLLKSFPLTGYTEVRYDSVTKSIIHEPVKLTQQYRNFKFDTPWINEKK